MIKRQVVQVHYGHEIITHDFRTQLVTWIRNVRQTHYDRHYQLRNLHIVRLLYY